MDFKPARHSSLPAALNSVSLWRSRPRYKSTSVIDATTIDDIKQQILQRKGGSYISLILFCRYRRDEASLPWRIAANNINYHYRSGEELDIYVPGFSFYGRSKGGDLGTAVKLENAKPFGFYYPKVFNDAEDFLRKEMKGFHLGSSVVAVAIEVQDGVPDWKNGAVMNLSQRSAEDAESQIMMIIEGCKSSPGRTPPSANFQRNFRLNGLVNFLSNYGWSAASTFTGVGALFLS